MRGVLFTLCCAAAVCTAVASDLGESALQSGDLRSATRFYREEIEKAHPGDKAWQHAMEQLFWIAIREGDLKAAKGCFEQLGSQEKQDPPRMRTFQTALLFAEGSFAKAAETAALPLAPAPTPEEALKLFSWRNRALLALRQYEAAEKAALDFIAAYPKSGTQGKMIALYSAIFAGDTETVQRLFGELEKSPDADPAALKKMRFLQQIREQKEPQMPGADAPRSSVPDELLYDAYSLLADRAESAAKPEIAIAALKLAAEAAPDQRARRNIRSRLLNAYLSSGKKNDAADCAELLLNDTANQPAAYGDALLRAARLRLEAGHSDLAVRFYNKAVEDKSLPVACRIAAARECAAIHVRAKEYDKAQSLFDFILTNGADDGEKQEGNFRAGEAAYSRGDYRGAAEFFRKSQHAPAWHDRSLFWLIQSCIQLHEFNTGLDAAEALAASKDPDFAVSGAFYRASLLKKQGRKADAAAAYTKFCAAYPKSTYVRDALLHSAALRKELKQYDQSVKDDLAFAAQFVGDDQTPIALCRAFESALLGGQRPLMGEILKQLMTRYPNSPCTAEAIFCEVDLLHAEQRDTEALALLDRLSKLQPSAKPEQVAQILYERARLLDVLGRQNQALKELQTLLGSYPNALCCADAMLLAGSIHSDLGEYEKAAEDYRQAAALRPGGTFAEICEGRIADCYYSRAALKYNEKLLASALEIYRKLSESRDFRVGAQSLYKSGRCLELAGKDDEALTVYNDMLYAAVSAKKKGQPWSPEWVSRAVYAGCMIYLDDGSANSVREAVRMLRLFRSLGVETGENFDVMEKKIREKYRL